MKKEARLTGSAKEETAARAPEGLQAEPTEPPTPKKWYRRLDPRWITGNYPFFPLLVLFGLNAVDELDRSAFAVLAPEIRKAFGLNIQGVLTLQALIIPVGILVAIPVGFYADRLPRLRIAALGASVWGVFSATTGMAANLAMLGIARAGSAIGKTVNDPTHNSLLADFYPLAIRSNVYYAHRIANPVGQFLGPLAAGFLAGALTWRAPFFLLAIPTFVFVFLSFKLKEPRRGEIDRLDMGADAETASTEEPPPTWRESWRMLWSVRGLRRVYFSLPFIATSVIGLQSLLAIFYDEVFKVSVQFRGVLQASDEIFNVAGLVAGGVIGGKLLRSGKPARLAQFTAVTAVGTATGIAIIAVSPNLAVAVAGSWVRAFAGAMLIPGLYVLGSLTIPPRVRSLGFASTALWGLPGLIFLPIIGGISDRFGVRLGLVGLLPIYVFGFMIIASAAKFIESDMRRVRASSLAQAEAKKARLAGDPKILICRNVNVAYDQVQVLFDVDFEVYDGEIVALLGTNGAGKSTLLKAITGLVEPFEGAVIFDGRDITSTDPADTTGLGAVAVPGGRGIFPSLTVAENLRVSCWMYRRESDYVKNATAKVLSYFPQLEQRWNTPAGALSGGEQQMLSLAQAFVARPKILLIDELSLGLAPTVVQKLLDIVRAINANGTAIVLVEQSVTVALKLAKRAVFMEKGEVRFSGPTEELMNRPDILRAVFLKGAAAHTTPNGKGNGRKSKGKSATDVVRREERRRAALTDAGVILETLALTKRYGGVTAVDQVDLQLRDGEILGLIGPNGAGKTTLFDLVSGFQPVDAGRMLLHGSDITGWSPSRRAAAGLGRSFQDARLWPSLTLKETLAVAFERTVDDRSALRALFNLPVVQDSERDVSRRVEEVIELLGLGAFRDKFISELSTGSRRIVEIGCALAHRPTVLLLDEPSSGIAQKETEALGPLLREVRNYMGCGMVVIEHDMPLITALADRIVALDLGRVIADGDPDEVTNNPGVIESYLGTKDQDLEKLV